TNTALTELYSINNQLTSLDISKNTALTILHLQNNQLTSLDLSNNIALTELRLQNGNQLTSLDLSTNTALTELYSINNQLTSLDISKNTALTILHLQYNQLTSLDLSNNILLTELRLQNGNQLTSLDLSKNTALTILNCGSNQLTSLDVSKNTALTDLRANSNQLTSLDVSKNTALIELHSSGNQLTTLDLSTNTALTKLYFHSNQLTSLDLSKNTALTTLDLNKNTNIASLDVSKNTALTIFKINNNKLTSLDLSTNTALTTLYCAINQLTSLDVSNNRALTYLQVSNNKLTSLNIKNGVSAGELYAQGNSDLTCIETSDPAYHTANWTYANGNIDAGVTFSVLCGSSDLSTWYVDTTGSDGQGAGTAESPFASIQIGINAASSGDTVTVKAGTYVENINYNGKNIFLIGEDREITIIDGNQNGNVVKFVNSETSDAILSGFTITNGLNSGIWIASQSDPTLTDLNIQGNIVSNEAGGIYIKQSSSPTITNVTIRDNITSGDGGGIHIREQSTPIISDVIIENNHARHGGGLSIYLSDTSLEIHDILIAGNTTTYDGGGILFSQYPGGLGIVTLSNATLSNNQCGNGGNGGGIFFGVHNNALAHPKHLTLRNSIMWNNGAEEIHIASSDDTVSIDFSDIMGGSAEGIINKNSGTIFWGEGNIDANPLFVDPDSGDYHLFDWSPAIGAGTTTGASTTDIEGNPRPNPAGSNPDMGAFENKWGTSQSAPPVITAVSDVTINEDEFHIDTLSATDPDNDPITYSATSDTNAVTASITDSILTITPNANWNGVVNIKAYASDGNSKDSTSFVLTVTSVQDAPAAFEWVSSALDSINITKDNVSSDYTLKWTESVDVDNDTIDYIMYAKIGIYPLQEIYDTTALTLPIPYEEIAASAFEGLPGNAATVRFTVWAHDGIDSVQVSGEDRVLYVNRYEYLSTESEGVPVEFALHENYPNPFNPTTQIRFDLPEMANVNLIIYNMLGQKIKSFNIQSAPTGYHAVTWNATNDLGVPVSAGIYLYQLQTEGFIKTKKMILLK
ncbi:MAG: right-handed parallel beta-helix repeat-containing protein, partial [Candidatus Marinimicrobia bacterium]|nr:right-handed parallel beta-helix repeat-containing protein [Candidatus Neomarinimicrobiota bacterium]